MKKLILFLIIVLGLIWWFGSNDETNEVKTGDAEPEVSQDGDKLSISRESTIRWTGKKPLIVGYEDTGTIPLKEGFVFLDDNDTISGGEFIFDIKNITPDKTGSGGGESRLQNHLRSADFFDVEKFPESKFVITKIDFDESLSAENANALVTGNLTIKDTTNSISFPALITEDNDKFKISATFDIDRTKWNIRYGSGSFFDNLGELVIDDIVKLNIEAFIEINN